MKAKHSKRKLNHVWWISVTACVSIICIMAVLLLSGVFKNQDNSDSFSDKSDTVSVSDKTDSSAPIEPAEPVKVSSATILSTGDIMVHEPQLNGAKVPGKQEWDFTAFFKEVKPYFEKADFSVANLETTFAGNENYSYAGYPLFNTPDSLIDAIKDSGLSMVLTANNHCYDTKSNGLERTQKILNEKEVPYVGTRLTEDAPMYTVQEVNGIRIGITAYTYETGRPGGTKYINGIPVKESDNKLINSFSYDLLDEFYVEVETIMSAMKNDGAEATIFYMHWGNEYQTEENDWQNKIAQALCDRGVDVIVGGHPHVIQPLEMLTSKDGKHQTVCIYSLGNAVSNQRVERMDSCPSGHTEDGLLFYCTFDKYSDGKVILSDIDLIPTWVDMYKGGSGYQYTICPLESAEYGVEKYGFTGIAATKSKKSYKRTVEIVAEGLTACQEVIGCQVTFPKN